MIGMILSLMQVRYHSVGTRNCKIDVEEIALSEEAQDIWQLL